MAVKKLSVGRPSAAACSSMPCNAARRESIWSRRLRMSQFQVPAAPAPSSEICNRARSASIGSSAAAAPLALWGVIARCASGLFAENIGDEVAEQFLERGKRGQIHHHRDVATQVPLANREIDVEEQHEIALIVAGV